MNGWEIVNCSAVGDLSGGKQCINLDDCGDWCYKAKSKPYGTWEEILMLVLTLICCCILAVVIVYFVKNKTTKVVKRVPFAFLMAICAGYGCLLFAQLAWPLENNTALCFIKPWFLAIGFGLIAGAMLVRIYRTYYIFALAVDPTRPLQKIMEYNQPDKREKRNRNLYFIFGGIITVEVVIILLMQAIPQSRPELVIQYCPPDECGTGSQCRVPGDPGLCRGMLFSKCSFNAAFGYAAFIVNAIPLCFGIFWVFRIFEVGRRIRRAAIAEKAKRQQTIGSRQPDEEKSTTEMIDEGLREQADLLRPVLYVIVVVGVVGLILVVVAYADIPTQSYSARIAYYVSRCVAFLFVIMTTMMLLFSPIVQQIEDSKRQVPGLSETVDGTHAAGLKKPGLAANESFMWKNGQRPTHDASSVELSKTTSEEPRLSSTQPRGEGQVHISFATSTDGPPPQLPPKTFHSNTVAQI